MPAIAREGVELYYDVKGDGPPLMLVAGLAADSAFWLPSLDAFAARHRVVVIDNRGAGRTTPLDAATSIRSMADDCLALSDHLQLTRLSLVGHSMGGMIAQECAMRQPERIDRLVLVSTTARPTPENVDLLRVWSALFPAIDRALWFRTLFHWVLSPRFFDDRAGVDALVTLATDYPYQQTPEALAHQVEAIAGFDARHSLSSIRARTLVLTGSLDRVFPPEVGAALARSIPGASFATVDAAAHSFPIETPAAFTRPVLEFLA